MCHVTPSGLWARSTKFFILLNHPAKSGVYRSHGSRDMTSFKYHVITACKIYRIIIRYHHTKFVNCRFHRNGDIAIFTCHVTPHDQNIKRSNHQTSAKFGVFRSHGSGVIAIFRSPMISHHQSIRGHCIWSTKIFYYNQCAFQVWCL